MRRARVLGVAVCACALLGGAAQAKAPTQIGVTAHDDDTIEGMTLTLSPAALPKAPPGPARIQLHNAGGDPHDMVIKRLGGSAKHRFDELPPGQSQELELKLKAGSRYNLWCTLPGHRSQGMEATMRVKGR
jgi:hypothetical protein